MLRNLVTIMYSMTFVAPISYEHNRKFRKDYVSAELSKLVMDPFNLTL